MVWVAGSDDEEAVTRLMLAFRDWWARDWPDDEKFADGVRRLMSDPGTTYVLGAVDGEPAAGVCQLRFRYGVWYDALDCELEDLYVDESARGHGLGGAILACALEHARERGARRIQLDANAANEPAQALYRRHGFASFSDPPGGEDLLLRRRLDDR